MAVFRQRVVALCIHPLNPQSLIWPLPLQQLLLDGLVVAFYNSLVHITLSVPGSGGGRLCAALEAWWSTDRIGFALFGGQFGCGARWLASACRNWWDYRTPWRGSKGREVVECMSEDG